MKIYDIRKSDYNFSNGSNKNKHLVKLGTLSQQGGRVAGDQPYFPNCIWEILKNPKVLKNGSPVVCIYLFWGILATYNIIPSHWPFFQ